MTETTEETTVQPTDETQPPAKVKNGKGEPPPAEKTFTQADLDYQLGQRAKEAKKVAINELFKELGVENADALKAVIKAKKDADEAAKTAEQKALDQIAALEKERDEARQRAESAEAARLTDRVNGKLEAAASKMKAQYPADVVELIRKNKADEVKALVNDEGVINDKGIEKLIEYAKKERPSWFAVMGPGSPSNRDGKPPGGDLSKQFGEQSLVRGKF